MNISYFIYLFQKILFQYLIFWFSFEFSFCDFAFNFLFQKCLLVKCYLFFKFLLKTQILERFLFLGISIKIQAFWHIKAKVILFQLLKLLYLCLLILRNFRSWQLTNLLLTECWVSIFNWLDIILRTFEEYVFLITVERYKNWLWISMI